MRVLTLNSVLFTVPYKFEFDPDEMVDSFAFRYVLYDIDPGDKYTVTFENKEDKEN